MIAAAHIITGGVIGSAVANPWLAVPLAIASHYMLDFVPHKEYPVRYRRIADPVARRRQFWRDVPKALTDIGTGLLTVWLCTSGNLAIVCIGLLAFSPDFFHLADDAFARRHGAVYTAHGTNPYANRPMTLGLRIRALQRTVHMRMQPFDADDIPVWMGIVTQGAVVSAGIILLLA
jgi:hypothetical protein